MSRNSLYSFRKHNHRVYTFLSIEKTGITQKQRWPGIILNTTWRGSTV